jgi:hypothetical protein
MPIIIDLVPGGGIQIGIKIKSHIQIIISDGIKTLLISNTEKIIQSSMSNRGKASINFAMSPSQCCGSGMFIPDPDFYPSRSNNNKAR